MPVAACYAPGNPKEQRRPPMNTFLEILSQLFWAVTAGALIAAAVAGAKLLGAIAGLVVGGLCVWRWMKKRRKDR